MSVSSVAPLGRECVCLKVQDGSFICLRIGTHYCIMKWAYPCLDMTGEYASSPEVKEVQRMELAARKELDSERRSVAPTLSSAPRQPTVAIEPVPHPILPDALALEVDYWRAIQKPEDAAPHVVKAKAPKKEVPRKQQTVKHYLSTLCARGALRV